MSTSRRTDTPMMQQYLALKARAPEALLLFRLGDFYELFMEDAEVAAPLLELMLTTRDRDLPDPVPMCGIPAVSLEGYVKKLLAAGHAVAIAEQVEDPRSARGLVRRDIVEVVTPGLVANADRLDGARGNYLAAVAPGQASLGFAYLDVSTGEFGLCDAESRGALLAELDRVAPREILVPEGWKGLPESLPLRALPGGEFDVASSRERVGRLPEGLEAADDGPGARAAAAIWSRAARLQPAALPQLTHVRRYRLAERMSIDAATRRHLELVANLRDGGTRGTLLELLDRSATAMGKRRLLGWLGEPLLDPQAIERRQQSVADWLEPDSRRRALARALRGVGDLERLLTRACLPGSAPRELAALRASLGALAEVAAFAPLPDIGAPLRERLDAVLVSNPPAPPRGEPYVGYVRDGADDGVDRIRADAEEGNRFLAGFESRERERTGLSTLKLKYNRVFGYALELSRAQAPRAPADYRRRQTTAHAERFTTDELERWEGVVLRSRERAAAAESAVLERLRGEVAAAAAALRATAAAVAELDTAQALAEVAREGDWVRPAVDRSLVIEIEAGRHPVVERFTAEGFVPNDVQLDPEGAGLLVLTGPNMAGKSTLLRQLALIVLLAQMGSFVPARRARIGVADRIFTRVGASDSLVTGESTFMVEMRETATILREATARSLVLLDEIGRGTSTFDGLSIAWAVTEHLHDAPGLRPRTLFATHYHELADLARTKSHVRNFHFACAERDGEILFLRQMREGAASRSYGIEVARRAGLPPEVVRRAREVLANLEGGEFDERGQPRLARHGAGRGARQMGLFEPPADPLRAALLGLDVDSMKPLDALVELDRLRRMAREFEP
jgi:DNA mismatch repair protein MutS